MWEILSAVQDCWSWDEVARDDVSGVMEWPQSELVEAAMQKRIAPEDMQRILPLFLPKVSNLD